MNPQLLQQLLQLLQQSGGQSNTGSAPPTLGPSGPGGVMQGGPSQMPQGGTGPGLSPVGGQNASGDLMINQTPGVTQAGQFAPQSFWQRMQQAMHQQMGGGQSASGGSGNFGTQFGQMLSRGAMGQQMPTQQHMQPASPGAQPSQPQKSYNLTGDQIKQIIAQALASQKVQ